ncbi:uncharacterized protein LOC107364156 [Tetranychus urticae]|uniref:Uncharacterized protein n=1 Tax=Tetranychus urticae TaxID=32264 RepID=T1KHI0_TETUR|nr:uncharacterized protein LOC107364054 [Tetranychus urticae]XP_015786966.1 uncharacterized protein LOC107364156 [Tetranychus urticae]
MIWRYIFLIGLYWSIVDYVSSAALSEPMMVNGENIEETSSPVATDWKRIADCFKRKLGPKSDRETEVRCAGREMVAVFATMRSTSCKNCHLYFHCLANYNAIYNCGQAARALNAVEAVGACHDFDEERDEFEASKHGRSGGDCAARYLCSANCNYNPASATCSRVNCRTR